MSSQPSLSKSKKASPLPLASMMDRLWSTPPHTLGLVRPACWATSTYWTGEVVGLDTAASTRPRSLHFHRGVARASVSVLPSMKREEPRKRRRGKIIDCDDYRDFNGLHRNLSESNSRSLPHKVLSARFWLCCPARLQSCRKGPRGEWGFSPSQVFHWDFLEIFWWEG